MTVCLVYIESALADQVITANIFVLDYYPHYIALATEGEYVRAFGCLPSSIQDGAFLRFSTNNIYR